MACNGGIQGKEANKVIPEAAEEIAESVHAAYEAGASMVHIHARDPKQLTEGARDAETWRDVLRKVRQCCPEIILNATTGAGPGMTMAERAACLAAGPEVASLNLAPDMSRFKLKERRAPLPFPRPALEIDECIPFTYGQIHEFAAEMKQHGIKPELELYHPGCAWVVNYLIEHNLIEKPYWMQTVMGYQTGSFPTVENIIQMLKEFPRRGLVAVFSDWRISTPVDHPSHAHGWTRSGRFGRQRLLFPGEEGKKQRRTRRASGENCV